MIVSKMSSNPLCKYSQIRCVAKGFGGGKSGYKAKDACKGKSYYDLNIDKWYHVNVGLDMLIRIRTRMYGQALIFVEDM